MQLAKLEQNNTVLKFYCLGCKDHHWVNVAKDKGPNWHWNQSLTKPTITPSILVSSSWGEQHEIKICHSYVTDGKWNYLSDCTHALKDKTVDMIDPDTPAEWGD